jgi:hypothetical protein
MRRLGRGMRGQIIEKQPDFAFQFHTGMLFLVIFLDFYCLIVWKFICKITLEKGELFHN